MEPVIDKKFTLNNGLKMPAIGFGTFRIRNERDIMFVVDKALAAGYRMFDTAAVYGNETYLGNAFRTLLPKYGLKRKDIFITTKLSPSDHGGGDRTREAYFSALKRLGMEYVDLYLIHWPGVSGVPVEDQVNGPMRDNTWACLAKLYQDGQVGAIGVSNYTITHLQQLLENNHGVIPAVNQVEWHPYYHQEDLKNYCEKNSIILQAYCSFGGTSVNDKSLMTNETIVNIAEKIQKTPSQILLKWAVQQNVAIIPKSMSEQHIKDNLKLDFSIPEVDLKEINSLKQVKYAWNPNTVV